MGLFSKDKSNKLGAGEKTFKKAGTKYRNLVGSCARRKSDGTYCQKQLGHAGGC